MPISTLDPFPSKRYQLQGNEMKPFLHRLLLPIPLLLFVFYLAARSPTQILAVASGHGGASHPKCKAWLVQSIPTDMPDLPRVSGVLQTGEVLRWLAGNATKGLDVIVQYWQLLAAPENPKSGDYGYSAEDMRRFGADEGRAVYASLEDAADRNVNLRILQHSGVYPDYVQEASNLASGRPNVENVTLLLSDWWGSGIVHAKVWISDGKDIYIGSANNDWKSLTQVKEVGIYLVGCPSIAKWLSTYFNNLWKLSHLNSTTYTRTVWDEQWQVKRKVPCWSHFIHEGKRCRSPFPHSIKTRTLMDTQCYLIHLCSRSHLRPQDMIYPINIPIQAIFHLHHQSFHFIGSKQTNKRG